MPSTARGPVVEARKLAKKIDRYLKAFEADRDGANAPRKRNPETGEWGPGEHDGHRPFFKASAKQHGRWVRIRYDKWVRDPQQLTIKAAEQYLAWLEAGNVGTHLDAGIDRLGTNKKPWGAAVASRERWQ